MKCNVIIRVECEKDDKPFLTTATVHADNAVEAVKKVIRDVEKLWGEVEE